MEHRDDEPHRCAGCKRPLKHRSSSGYGPVCERRIHGQPADRPRAIAVNRNTTPTVGQAELPLADQLDLWPTTDTPPNEESP